MNHPDELIRAALHKHFSLLKDTTLPELWRVTFPVEISVLKYMTHGGLQVWFCSYSLARKLGMWWTMDHQDRVTLHGTRGKPPVVDSLSELVMWTCAEAEALAVADPGRVTNKNLTLLTRATEPYSY